jgi:copper ion binding protein
MSMTFDVDGMSCQHCVANVKKALEAVDGVEAVAVELNPGKVTVEGSADAEAVKAAITGAGYTVKS